VLEQTPAAMRSILTRLCAWLLASAAIVLTVVPSASRPLTGFPHAIEHFCFFLLCGLAFAAGYPRRELALAMMAVAFTAALETLQVRIPGRHARLSDFLVDACAMLAEIAIASLLRRAHAASVTPDQHQMP
jgi:VanZ family protein